MSTSVATRTIQNTSIRAWAAVLLCAAGAASCSRSSRGSSRALDGAVDGPTSSGVTTGGTGSGAGMSSAGGASGGGSTEIATTTSPGGATSAGGSSLAGGTGGVTKTTATGGSGKDSSASLRDGGVGGNGGSHASGGVSTSGAAGAGGSSSTLASGSGGSALGGSATGGSKPDGGIATAPDASVRSDGPLADMPTYREFSVLIAGTWLVGRTSGDTRNYSWVRLSGRENGTAEYLSGANLPSNTPFWACDGQATWNATAAPYAIMLDFPSSCPSGLPGYFVFRAPPETAVAPPGATFGMVDPANSSVRPMTEWWRFPDDQCDATMSACKSPF